MNGDCYFTRECEALGVPLIVTPIESFKEQGLKDGENCYYIPFNMENIDINKIANNIPSYDGYLLNDKWEEILEKGKSIYKEEKKMKYLVEATEKYAKKNDWDVELSEQKGVKKYTPKKGEQWEVDYARKEKLVELGYVKEIREIKEESDEEKNTEDTKEENKPEVDEQETKEDPVEESVEEEPKEEVSEDTKEELKEDTKEEVIETAKKDIKAEKAVKNTSKKNK